MYKGEHLETVWGFPYLVYTLVTEHSQSMKFTVSFREQSPVFAGGSCCPSWQHWHSRAVWDAAGTGAQLPAQPGGCLSSVLPCARQECPAGWWWLSFALYLSPASAHLGLPTLQGVQGLVLQLLWEVGMGRIPCMEHTMGVACPLFVAEDRHKPAEIPVCCTPARLWLCSTAGEGLAVLHTGATWTALPRTGGGTWVSCSGAAQASVPGLEILSATSSPSVAQGKA